ncbi:MAG: hypothetical protein ACE5ES_00880 [Candidatus Nanoarchaeia archaeon]
MDIMIVYTIVDKETGRIHSGGYLWLETTNIKVYRTREEAEEVLKKMKKSALFPAPKSLVVCKTILQVIE